MECEKLQQEKTEMQRAYVMVGSGLCAVSLDFDIRAVGRRCRPGADLPTRSDRAWLRQLTHRVAVGRVWRPDC